MASGSVNQASSDTNIPEHKTNNKKRKITWYLHEWAGDNDPLNAPEAADGTLKPLTEFSGAYTEDGVEITPTSAVPEELAALWKQIYDINGEPFYDPVALALGTLDVTEYMLIPSDWKIEICPIADVGAGLKVFKVDGRTIAGVYALAKEQARLLKLSHDDQVKWAVLRTEAFKAGWFAKQKYTMYKAAPEDAVATMLADEERLLALAPQAYELCLFIPFMTEYHFRAFGSAYNKSTADYVSKAQDLAASASLSKCLSYMDNDLLYGKALAWIGVERPMQVLTCKEALTRVPYPFKTRAYAAPAGQALITSSIAVIESIKAAGWWEDIKKAGRYDDSMLLKVGNEIASNPWKYHLYCHAYGVQGPNAEESKLVDLAKADARKFAPVLQAYVETVVKGKPLGRIKALKKYADVNRVVFLRARGQFKEMIKHRAKSASQGFAEEVFGSTEVLVKRMLEVKDKWGI